MNRSVTLSLLVASSVLTVAPASAESCDFNKDTVELLRSKFSSLQDKYQNDVNLIVGLGTNTDDKARRIQLFNDWGGVNGRVQRQKEIKDYADFLASLVDRCK